MLSLLPVLGVDAFEPTRAASKRRRVFSFKGSEWDATGYETSNGFAVQAGSTARGKTGPTMTSYVGLRRGLIRDGVLVAVAGSGEAFRFEVGHEFASPSGAAAVIAGRNTNGREAWKDARGVSLKQHQQREAGEG